MHIRVFPFHAVDSVDVQGVYLSTVDSVDVQGVSLSAVDSVEVHGVSLSIACSVEMESVSSAAPAATAAAFSSQYPQARSHPQS
jgi:hypothetical protein